MTDGLGGTQTFTVNVGGTNPFDPPNPWVAPINGTDTITTPANTAYQFTPVGESAASTPLPRSIRSCSSRLLGPISPRIWSTTPMPAPTRRRHDQSLHEAHARWFKLYRDAGQRILRRPVLEITAQSATPASWDAGANVNPVYRAYVPVYVDPPTPQIASISVDGQTVSGSTFANNSTTATELSFNITGRSQGPRFPSM